MRSNLTKKTLLAGAMLAGLSFGGMRASEPAPQADQTSPENTAVTLVQESISSQSLGDVAKTLQTAQVSESMEPAEVTETEEGSSLKEQLKNTAYTYRSVGLPIATVAAGVAAAWALKKVDSRWVRGGLATLTGLLGVATASHFLRNQTTASETAQSEQEEVEEEGEGETQ